MFNGRSETNEEKKTMGKPIASFTKDGITYTSKTAYMRERSRLTKLRMSGDAAKIAEGYRMVEVKVFEVARPGKDEVWQVAIGYYSHSRELGPIAKATCEGRFRYSGGVKGIDKASARSVFASYDAGQIVIDKFLGRRKA